MYQESQGEEFGAWRKITPQDYPNIVREVVPEKKVPSVLHRGPLTRQEEEDIAQWMAQRVRGLTRIPKGRAPTTWEIERSAALMMCLIRIVDADANEDGGAWIGEDEIAAVLGIIVMTPTPNRHRYARKIAHELAHRLMVAEVARELFGVDEVHIEGCGCSNERVRQRMARRVEDILFSDT